jgi:hypothetical protein
MGLHTIVLSVFRMTEGCQSGIPLRDAYDEGEQIMRLKSAGFLVALALATSSAAAAPLPHLTGVSAEQSLTQQVRHRHYLHHWYGYWRHCPYWYEPDFWGSWRLFSPCSNKVITHAY